jgi:hypothetical protein
VPQKCVCRAPQNKLYRDIATYVTFPHFWDWRDTYVFLELQMSTPSTRLSSQTISLAVDCCVLESDQLWFAPRRPELRGEIVEHLPSPPHPTQLIVTSPDRSMLPRLSTKSIRAGREQFVSFVPSPPSHLVPKSNSNRPPPNLGH